MLIALAKVLGPPNTVPPDARNKSTSRSLGSSETLSS